MGVEAQPRLHAPSPRLKQVGTIGVGSAEKVMTASQGLYVRRDL
jgi:hypothetical protein